MFLDIVLELIHILVLRQYIARLVDSLKSVWNGSPLLLVIDQLVSSFHGVCNASMTTMSIVILG